MEKASGAKPLAASQPPAQKRQRFWELDFSRGVAVLMMVAFHFAFDLAFFSIYLQSK